MLLMDKPTEVLQERVNGIFRGCRETESRHFFFFKKKYFVLLAKYCYIKGCLSVSVVDHSNRRLHARVYLFLF